MRRFAHARSGFLMACPPWGGGSKGVGWVWRVPAAFHVSLTNNLQRSLICVCPRVKRKVMRASSVGGVGGGQTCSSVHSVNPSIILEFSRSESGGRGGGHSAWRWSDEISNTHTHTQVYICTLSGITHSLSPSTSTELSRDIATLGATPEERLAELYVT